jgi:putative ABC transport system permease protein
MLAFILIRMSFRAICHHTIRSLLTLLGIVIGIAGIIAISAVGKGAQKKAREQFLASGSKKIQLCEGNWMSSSQQKASRPFTLDDIIVVQSQCPAVQYISPVAYRNGVSLDYEGQTFSAEVIGTNENHLAISEENIEHGLFFTKEHFERKENVVVLSPAVAEFFFKLRDPLGAVIRISKVPFTVIGVFTVPKVKGKWDGLGLPKIVIPFLTHQKYFGKENFNLMMSTYTDEQVAEVVRQLEKIFRAAHNIEEGGSNDFMIWDNQTFAEAAEEASKSVGLFALIAAIIALIVGGIGVMNIMLVAVQERTKEIGIKAALGATMNFIRMQFLVEAITICMVGGVIGIAFGIAASYALAYWIGMATIIELTPIVVSFFCTILIGLIFGFYPAERAARLNPVEALTEY